MNRLTRRSLVLGTAAVPVLAIGAGKLWCQTYTTPGAPIRLSALMAMYVDADAAAALGKRYLWQTSSTALSALDRLQANERLRCATATGCPVETASAVQQACR